MIDHKKGTDSHGKNLKSRRREPDAITSVYFVPEDLP
jgi:hypothetical protein